MPRPRLPKFRFRLGTFMALFLGVAIGLAINPHVIRSLFAPATESNMRTLPTYVIEPPDILFATVTARDGTSLDASGKRQVAPDGTVALGSFGSAYVAGMTLEEAQETIERQVRKQAPKAKVLIDVYGYNSKKYYIVVETPGQGDSIVAAPVTGNETVLDAISLIGGFGQMQQTTTTIHVARPSLTGERILPVDYKSITRGASTNTNYQLLPGDRLVISQTAAPAPAQTHNDKPDVEVTSFEE
jgi:protein involved in polysaccharide export with SLBB domain